MDESRGFTAGSSNLGSIGVESKWYLAIFVKFSPKCFYWQTFDESRTLETNTAETH